MHISNLQMFRFLILYFPRYFTTDITGFFQPERKKNAHYPLFLKKKQDKPANSRLRRRSSTRVNRGTGKPGSSWLSGCRRWPGQCRTASRACRWSPKHPVWNLHWQSASVSLPPLLVSVLLKLDTESYHLYSK